MVVQVIRDPYAAPQPRLFDLEAPRGVGWLKALRLEGYTFRRPGPPQSPQSALFPFSVG